jgi:1-acyl-sn-glycerol-3-phosphate acyltransferase
MNVVVVSFLWILLVIIGVILIVWLYGLLVRPSFVPYSVRYIPLRFVARLLCFIFGIEIEVSQRENLPDTKGKRGYAIVGNHQSNWDAVILVAVINDPVSFVAKKELARIPVLGTWAKTLRAPFIDRKNLRQSYSAVMVKGAENIKHGIAMIIFPSGTRSQSNDVGEFKAGSFKMASEIGAPILPITLENVYNVKKGNFFKRTKVKVYIHPWIEQSEYKELTSFELARHTQDVIAQPLLNEEKEEN